MSMFRKTAAMSQPRRWTDDIEENKLFYFRRRQRNRFHEALLKMFMRLREEGHFSKGDLARRSHKDAAQITRILASPTNLTLDTISDVLLAMDCELEPTIMTFDERRSQKSNSAPRLETKSASEETKHLPAPQFESVAA